MKPANGIFDVRSVRVSIVTAAILSELIASLNAGEPAISIHALKGSLYVAEDSHYAKTNYLVYVGPKSVTVVGAGWSPEAAELFAQEIQRITDKPIEKVIIPDHDPEYAGGIAYWKRIGAKIIATETTERALETEWPKATEFARKYFPTYPNVPLELPTNVYQKHFELENGDIRAFYLGPSHNADDIFVYFPKEKILYAGSILKEQLGNLASADLTEYPRTLHKLQELHLNIDNVVSGHWSPVHGPELIDRYLTMLKDYSQKPAKD